MKKRANIRQLRVHLAVLGAVLVALMALPQRAYAQTPNISYQTHVQTYGWQEWKANGSPSGTTGESKRLESIKITVDGAGISGGVSYRVHSQSYGWMKEVSNGEPAGTSGQSKRLEAIEIRLVAKDRSKYAGMINYISHAQSYGWLNWMNDEGESGTTGQSKRLEAVRIEVNPSVAGVSGGVRYRAHVQDYGWQDWAYNGAIGGTTGQSKRLEAIQIELTGALKDTYDVWYCTHVQSYGWQPWVKNGASSGTSGQSKRLEAIRIQLVRKGESSPSNVGDAASTPIMGASVATRDAMINHYNAYGNGYPSSVYKGKGAATIQDFVDIIISEAKAEGVRPDVVYAQAMLETGYLHFGGDVKAEQCNFAGIGATGGGARGATFPDVRTGIRAQVQHLKAYASTAALNNACVDPRFDLVERGVAPTLGALSERWATGSTYGRDINNLLSSVIAMN